MTHTCTKGQGQRSLGLKDRVETDDGQTDGPTDGGDYITSRAIARSVINGLARTTLTRLTGHFPQSFRSLKCIVGLCRPHISLCGGVI